MRKFMAFLAICGLCASLSARDDVQYYDIQEALSSAKAQKLLDPNIKLSFGSGTTNGIIVKGLQSNKKTNAFAKKDKDACTHAFLSALISFQQRAIKEGGTRVVNLTGYYKKQPFDSKTQFQCGAGAIMAGVTLRGDIAK